MNTQSVLRLFSRWIFIACGVWLIGLGAYFILARPPLPPEDLHYLGSSAIQVETQIPNLTIWLRNVFAVMGGFMAGCGVLTIFVGLSAIPRSLPGTGTALGFAGLLTVGALIEPTGARNEMIFVWN